MASAMTAALEAVRRTTTAHASAIDALERAVDAEMARLASDRRALEDDRAAFVRESDEKLARDEEEKARVKAATPPPDELVKLNVGGARFETSRAVLTKVKDSMLGRMFGRCDAMLQSDPEDGSIFIDRDGERFRMLLDFLRGNPPDGPRMLRTIRALPEAVRDALVQELDYFGLEAAVFGARPWTDGATFRLGPEMREERPTCAAVFAGGRVIVFGGLGGDSPSNTTEVLDMQIMAFVAGPNLPTGRFGCVAVQIDADRVLVVGGKGDASLRTTEILHLSTLTLTPGPDMQSRRNGAAAVALDARRFLVIGGQNDWSNLSSTEILSLDTMAFAPGPAMTTPRGGCAAVALDEHRIMVAGGVSSSGLLSTTEVLDIRTMAFATGPSMSTVRSFCAAATIDARHVLFIGGNCIGGTALATTELLDVATMEFEPGPTMQIARYACAATRINTAEGRPRILVIGGEAPNPDSYDDDDFLRFSSTEVLAVETQRGAPAMRPRQ